MGMMMIKHWNNMNCTNDRGGRSIPPDFLAISGIRYMHIITIACFHHALSGHNAMPLRNVNAIAGISFHSSCFQEASDTASNLSEQFYQGWCAYVRTVACCINSRCCFMAGGATALPVTQPLIDPVHKAYMSSTYHNKRRIRRPRVCELGHIANP